MTVSGSNIKESDLGGAANEGAANHQASSSENRLQQFFKGGDIGSGAFVPLGAGVSGTATLNGFSGQSGPKKEWSAAEIKASKKTDDSVDMVQSNSVDEKITAVKERIAELLETIDALIPGFTEEVQPQVETNAAVAIPTDALSDTTEKEAIKAALEELAQILEEIIGLLKGQDDSDTPGETEAIASNYAVDEDTAQNPKEQTGTEVADAFMSIFDQMSDSTKKEVVEILSTMAFEGSSQTISSSESVEGNNSEIYSEFIELVAERSGTENTPILNIDIAGIEVPVADGQGLALVEEPIAIDGKVVTDGAIIEVGDSVTLTDGRVLTLDSYSAITVEDPNTGLGESVTWDSTIPNDSETSNPGSAQQNDDSGPETGQTGSNSNTTQSGTAESGAGQSGESSDSAEAGVESGTDEAVSTGSGSDATGDGTAPQGDIGTEAGAGQQSGESSDTAEAGVESGTDEAVSTGSGNDATGNDTALQGDIGAEAGAGQSGESSDSVEAGAESGTDEAVSTGPGSDAPGNGTAPQGDIGTEAGAGQSGESSDSAGDGVESGTDAAVSTGSGNDATGNGPASQSDIDTEAGSGNSGGSTDSSGSAGGADTFSGTDSTSQGTRLDQIGVDGYYSDGVITVEEPVVIGGQAQNGAELKPGDQVTLANGNLLVFSEDGVSCYLHDISKEYGYGMLLG